MTIGLILECGPQGADKFVCEYLAAQLRPGVALVSRTMDDKPNLLAQAAMVAAALLADGCERVLIVWDLRPAWPDTTNKPCRAVERQMLLNSLNKAGLQDRPVFLVCIEQELEGWLLADEAKLAGYLSTATHPYSVARVRKPDRVGNPKSVVMNHFKKARGWRYEDRVHAIKVLRHDVPNWSRLRQSESFARFEAKLTC
jgi:Domain of unknown function (DUF4276)